MLSSIQFDNRFVDGLPGDTSGINRSRQVEGACYSTVEPRQALQPKLIAWSEDMARALGLVDDEGRLNGGDVEQFERVFSGTEMLPGMQPYAMCYGGHQFGQWAGQLGDGRAITLGEIAGQKGGGGWTLQLKGAGPTPYSRTADGLAVLRSSVREFLCSEAMHYLGIPTTRALSLVLTGENVMRDMFYDGNGRAEPGAVVCRVSRSFIRFGNFEIFAARGDTANLQQLVDFTIAEYFPDIDAQYSGKEKLLAWYQEIVDRTARLMSDWQRVGFVHGVMNTDNMSILGETIDYGPYGWLEPYQLDWTPNTTDAQGRRYCYGNQPYVAMWSLAKLGNALMPLVEDSEALQSVLETYRGRYEAYFASAMSGKLGLEGFDSGQDMPMVESLLDLMQKAEVDMTLFFRSLGALKKGDVYKGPEDLPPMMAEAFYDGNDLSGQTAQRLFEWIAVYQDRLRQQGSEDADRKAGMDAHNPLYVLRNYLAQQAIEKAEQGDYGMISEILTVLHTPYQTQPGREAYQQKRPEWARHKPGCSMLSCSS